MFLPVFCLFMAAASWSLGPVVGIIGCIFFSYCFAKSF